MKRYFRAAIKNHHFFVLALMLAFTSSIGLAKKSAENKKKESKSESTSEKENSLVLITDVVGESSKSISLITLTLNKILKDSSAVKISEHGRYLQLDLSNVGTAKPGTFYEANSPFFNKMALFETGEKSSALRIFTDESTKDLGAIAEVDVLGKRVILSLDHGAYKAKISGNSDTVASASEVKSTSNLSKTSEVKDSEENNEEDTESVALTKGIGSSEDKSESLPTSPASKTEDVSSALADIGVGKTSLDLSQNLANAAYFIGFMFLLLIGVLSFKRLKRNAFLAQKGTEDALRTLGTLSLNPKQQLNLVEVGGEKILLSVSNDTVSLISHIGGPKSSHAQISNQTQLTGSDSYQQRKLIPGSTEMQASSQTDEKSGFSGTLDAFRKKAQQINQSQTIPRANSASKTSKASRFSDAMMQGDRFSPQRSSTKSGAHSTASGSSMKQPTKGTKVNVAISDEGVKKVRDKKPSNSHVDDVTQLIRQKLKDLPKF